MPDLILLPFPGFGTIALSREQLESAREAARSLGCDGYDGRAGASQRSSPSQRLVTADELEVSTGVPSTWWMAQARERRIPFRKIGRRVRFVLDEVLQSETFRRHAKE
jgi:hypothetical protein